jgi:hypothetical protein
VGLALLLDFRRQCFWGGAIGTGITMTFMSIMAAPGVFIIFTMTVPVAENGGSIIPDIGAELLMVTGKPAGVLVSLPNDQCMEEMNFGDMVTKTFADSQENLSNDKERREKILTSEIEHRASNLILKAMLREESLA